MNDLEQRLRDLAGTLDRPRADIAGGVIDRIIAEDQPDLANAVTRRLLHRRRQRRAVLALLATIAVAAPVTAAVLRRWVIGGASVTRVTSLPERGASTLAPYGRSTTFERAKRDVDFAILRPRGPLLPDPVDVRAATTPPGGRVTLLYPPTASLPALAVPGVGAALTELRATVGPAFFDKMITRGTHLETLEIGGRPAIWLSGSPHIVIYHAADGIDHAEPVVLAGNVLLWQQGSLLLRLESRLDLDRSVRIARSIR